MFDDFITRIAKNRKDSEKLSPQIEQLFTYVECNPTEKTLTTISVTRESIPISL